MQGRHQKTGWRNLFLEKSYLYRINRMIPWSKDLVGRTDGLGGIINSLFDLSNLKWCNIQKEVPDWQVEMWGFGEGKRFSTDADLIVIIS